MKPVIGKLGQYIKARNRKERLVGLSQLHILSLSRVLFPLKKLQIASSPMYVNFFTSFHRRPHLLTAEGFLKDQIVLILFKVSIC